MPLSQRDRKQVFSVEAVSKHNTEEDGWIAIGGNVYDVSKFIKFHPGGRDIMIQNLGTDVTEAFASPDVHAHSEKAFRMLEQYKIGTIENTKAAQVASMDDKLSGLVDLSKPMVWQVYKMQGELYQPWLHAFPTTLNIRLFESAFCEFFSHYPWWYIFPMWVPVILYNIFASYSLGHNIATITAAYIGGLMFWTFMEYTLHRFLFHLETNTNFMNFYHFMAHGIHHLTPLDPTRLTFPPIFSVFVVAMFFYGFQLTGIPVFNTFFAGSLTGFMMYDAMHYFFHHGSLCEKIPYCKRMRSRHFRHHYVCGDRNFGVSTDFWDHVFRTCEGM